MELKYMLGAILRTCCDKIRKLAVSLIVVRFGRILHSDPISASIHMDPQYTRMNYFRNYLY